MRKLKKLLAAIAISEMALMPLANSAQAQVVVYNHGHRVRVAQTAKKDWSNIKSGTRTDYRKASNATTKEWSNIKSGVRYDTYRMSHGGKTSLAEQRQDARHEALYRARLRREQYRARLQQQR
ncbi:MAG: hypothetical protein ACHQNE_05330 [Candidatus Kapaibacterium sp.]